MSLVTSKQFASAAASGTDWRDISKKILEELETIRTDNDEFNFGFLYVSDYLADDAPSILNLFRSVLKIDHWIGSVGMGIIGNGEAFLDQPAISAMVGKIDEDDFCIFPNTEADDTDYDEEGKFVPVSQDSVKNWLDTNETMLVCAHADPMAEEDPSSVLADLELMTNGFVCGGLTSSRSHHYQFANHVCQNAVSGAFFSNSIPVATMISQGSEPISAFHTITKADDTHVLELNGEKAVDVLQKDLRKEAAKLTGKSEVEFLHDLKGAHSSDQIPDEFKTLFRGEIHAALPISQSDHQKDYLVRNIMGVDADEGSISISQSVSEGDRLLFVKRNEDTVLEDLSRSLLSLRERVTVEQGEFAPKACLYVTCIARGFSEAPSSTNKEIDLLHEIVGDVPMAGFYAGGEISNARLYGYTGLLILFL